MQLDYRQFAVKASKIAPELPQIVPYQEFVLGYVKAFYIPEADLESWVQAHKEVIKRGIGFIISSHHAFVARSIPPSSWSRW